MRWALLLLPLVAACSGGREGTANNGVSAAPSTEPANAAAMINNMAAAAPAAARPAAVQAVIDGYAEQCRAAGGRLQTGAQFEQRADFNGDGIDDYVLDPTRAECPPVGELATSVLGDCGATGSCSIEVLVSRDGGYREGVSLLVRGFSIVPGSPARLAISAHGSACGLVGAAACEIELAWNGRELARVEESAETRGAGNAVGPLGIPAGVYVDADLPCGEALSPFFYDGRRIGQLDANDRWDLRPVGRVRRNADWLVVEDHGLSLRRLPQGRIQLEIQDTGRPMRLCPRDQLPSALRP